uniref:Tensin 2a n=1 Tax=Oncorhynchus kisutch TaxID=8019 RepID=A0A8C7D2K3_ONCKI
MFSLLLLTLSFSTSCHSPPYLILYLISFTTSCHSPPHFILYLISFSTSCHSPPYLILHLLPFSTSFHSPHLILHLLPFSTLSHSLPHLILYLLSFSTLSHSPPPAILHLISFSTSHSPPPAILHLISFSTSSHSPPPVILHLISFSTSCHSPPHFILHISFSTSCHSPPHLNLYFISFSTSNQIKIKCIYISLRTSADISKCCTETQPKTPNSKQCRCRSTSSHSLPHLILHLLPFSTSSHSPPHLILHLISFSNCTTSRSFCGALHIFQSFSLDPILQIVMERHYDFDLTYITERIISVFFPPLLDEQRYRLNLKEVTAMLRSKHQDKFLLFNLSERHHDITRMNPKVLDFGWPDFHAPPLDKICAMCKAMETWLTSDPQHVVVLHCKGNKGKTGVIIAAYMHYSKISAGADQALSTLAMRKFCEDKVSSSLQPSQNRYIYYFGGLLSGAIKMNSSLLLLHQVLIPTLPNFQGKGGYFPFLKIYQSMQLVYTSGIYMILLSFFCCSVPSLPLCLSLQVKCYHRRAQGAERDTVFRLQFHTCTIHGAQLWFGKGELDEACTDERFPSDATVEFVFSSGPEKMKGREYQRNDPAVTVDYNTADPVVRWDSYENFNQRYQDSLDDIAHTRGPVDGSLYAQIKKRLSAPAGTSEERPSQSQLLSPSSDSLTHSGHSSALPEHPEESRGLPPPTRQEREDLDRLLGGIEGERDGLDRERETAILDDGDLSSEHTGTLRLDRSCSCRVGYHSQRCAEPGCDRLHLMSSGYCRDRAPGTNGHPGSPPLTNPATVPSHMDLCQHYSPHPQPHQTLPPPDLVWNRQQGPPHYLHREGPSRHPSLCPYPSQDLTSHPHTLHPGRLATSSPHQPQNHSATSSPHQPQNHNATPSPHQPQNHSATSSPHQPQNHSTTSSPQQPQNHRATYSPHQPQNHSATSSPHQPQNHSATSSPHQPQNHSATSSPHQPQNHSATYSPHQPQNHSTLPSPHQPQNPCTTPSPHQPQNHSATSSPHQPQNYIATSSPSTTTGQPSNHCHPATPTQTPTEKASLTGPKTTHPTETAVLPPVAQPQFQSPNPVPGACPLRKLTTEVPKSSSTLTSAPSSPQPPISSLEGFPSSEPPVPGFATLGRRLMLVTEPPGPLQHYPGMEGSTSGHSPAPEVHTTPTFPISATGCYPPSVPHVPYLSYTAVTIPQCPLPEKRGQSAQPGSPNCGVRTLRPTPSQHHVTFSPTVGEMAPPAGQGEGVLSLEREMAGRVSVTFVQDNSRFWYKPGISRDQAIAALKEREPGAFLIRDSNSFQGAYGLALKVATPPANLNNPSMVDPLEQLVRHFLIETGPRGVKIKGCQNEPHFGSLSALVYQHSITPISLPCSLRIPEKDPIGEMQELQSTASNMSTASDLLKQGAACNVLYLNSVETESLTGPQAISRATGATLAQNPRPAATVVHFKVSSQGITLTDSQRRVFFRRHYPVNSVTFSSIDPQDRRWTNSDSTTSKVFGFVAKKPGSMAENVCHLFAELDPEQPASAIVNFINKVMLGPQRR